MATPRKQVAAAIKAAHPGYVLDDYPSKPEQVSPGKPYVDCYETSREVVNGDKDLRIEIEVDIYSGKESLPAAWDEVEDARDDVMSVLQAMDGVNLTRAENKIFLDVYPGVSVKAIAYSKNVYKPKESK